MEANAKERQELKLLIAGMLTNAAVAMAVIVAFVSYISFPGSFASTADGTPPDADCCEPPCAIEQDGGVIVDPWKQYLREHGSAPEHSDSVSRAPDAGTTTPPAPPHQHTPAPSQLRDNTAFEIDTFVQR